MRLLNARTRELYDFISDESTPQYAILSHTWGDDEVQFLEWSSQPHSTFETRKGFRKIDACCKQALRDSLGWVWIDTCCIDKSSSAELSEAINSMFRWYQNAVLCYAHFSDVHGKKDDPDIIPELSRSRWFSRGWTLQELIAPKEVIFYSDEWANLGSKSELAPVLTLITGVEQSYLLGADLDSASVAKRMSWASRRNTSRVEDLSYCLLGIFDVNMPLVYGEGAKAFRRLQEEIIKLYPYDHSLFAWGEVVDQPASLVKNRNVIYGKAHFSDLSPEVIPTVSQFGLLAQSPKDFKFSASFRPMADASDFYRQTTRSGELNPPAVLGRGTVLKLTFGALEWCLRGCPKPDMLLLSRMRMVPILCYHEDEPESSVRIPLISYGHGQYGRTDEVVVDNFPRKSIASMKHNASEYIISPRKPIDTVDGDVVIRRNVPIQTASLTATSADTATQPIADVSVISLGRVADRRQVCFRYWVSDVETKPDRYFSLCLSRVAADKSDTGIGLLAVKVFLGVEGESELFGGQLWRDNPDWKTDVPSFQHAMSRRGDDWTVDLGPDLPTITVSSARMYRDDSETSHVDVVDVILLAPASKSTVAVRERKPGKPVTPDNESFDVKEAREI